MKNMALKSILFVSTLTLAGPLVAQVNTAPNLGNFAGRGRENGALIAKAKKNQQSVQDLLPDAQDVLKLKEIDLKKSFLQGGVNGGGGDEMAIAFKRSAYSALNALKTAAPDAYKKLSAQGISKVIDEASIFVVDDALDVNVKNLIQNSVAFNSPEQNVIVLNRARVNSIKDKSLMDSIALHEVLSLKRIEQTGYYPISGRLASVLGNSAENLSTELNVNRVQQLQALTPSASRGEILLKFFNEANQDVSMSDFESVESVAAGKNKKVCQTITLNGLNDFIESYAVTVDAIVKTGQPAVEDHGPLFPGQPAVPATVAKRIVLTDVDRVRGIVPGSLVLDNSEMTSTQKEIKVTIKSTEYGDMTYLYRKNNHLIAFKMNPVKDRVGNVFGFIGYCYNK